MSKELAKQGEKMPEAYGKYGDAGRNEIEISDSSFLRVVEGMSTEILESGVANIGDLVLAPAMVNVGKEIAVVMPFTKREWIMWKDGNPSWRCDRGSEAQLDEAKFSQTQRQGDEFPEAEDTLTFFCVEIDPKTQQLDPNGHGGFIASYSGGRFKTGKQLVALRNHFDGPPIFAVFNLKVETVKNDKGTYHVAKAHGLGGLTNDDTIKAVFDMHEKLKGMAS